MGSLAQIRHDSGKTHVEVTTSRQKRDDKDLATLTTWFQQRSPLDPTNGSLSSLSTGHAVSESEINCDVAEAVGSVTQKALDGVSVDGAIVKRKSQNRTLETSISVENMPIRLNPMVLLGRPTTLIKHEDEKVQQFVHELILEPTSLFTDGHMRKPN